ncbi:hypothetical protein PsorP6_008590 [Peronosclerospora sorghi]|uniref:Uncharacterized protein n=1 Tax=Peronosclerospora sorghi TaxID=230839 RepID=A0ACC0W8D6_9STRA|nr:hypothetical protein PsorP6_008590 [Peronosclerospora sorghi]
MICTSSWDTGCRSLLDRSCYYLALTLRMSRLSTNGFHVDSRRLRLGSLFMDPFSVLFSFQACVLPFVSGCLLGLGSSVLNLVELKSIHKRHKHLEYGLYSSSLGYGNASYGSFKQRV